MPDEHTTPLTPEATAKVLTAILCEQHGDGYFHITALRDGRRREHSWIKVGHFQQLRGFIEKYATRRLCWTPAVYSHPEMRLDYALPSPWVWTLRKGKLVDSAIYEWEADGALARLSRLDEPRKPTPWMAIYLPMPRVLLKVPA